MGRFLGRYYEHLALAAGGMATVSLGKHLGPAGFSRTVAIKRPHAHYAANPSFVRMFTDEARLAARIHHPNVVSTIDIVVGGGDLFLVMEYVHGASLSWLLSHLPGGRVPDDIAVAILVGVLDGLHAAHEARAENGAPLNIVHRDVSPQNVLVSVDGLARLVDFGIAKADFRLQTSTQGGPKGKLSYMAPEQFQATNCDRRTDLWAASVLLWEMVTGRKLFDEENAAAVVQSIVYGPPLHERPFEGNPDFRAVFDRGLRRDPGERFQDARQMAAALEAAVAPASAKTVASWLASSAQAQLDARAQAIVEMEQTLHGAMAGGAAPKIDALARTEAAQIETPLLAADAKSTTLEIDRVSRTSGASSFADRERQATDPNEPADPGLQLPDDAPKQGAIFAEKYRVEHTLGAGGMGYVLAATHVHLGTRVAIKMLWPQRTRDKDTVARFLREGRAAVKIRSEHVARVLDVGTTDSGPYIVMEYLEGLDLSQLLRQRGRLPHEVAVDYVLQVCEAIGEAHAMRTIHRDLKPANLFIARGPSGGECIKVLDFGISKVEEGIQDGMTKTESALGTPSYMAPEQLLSSKHVDTRADLWSLGVILFEIIAGERPFPARTVAELGAQVLTQPAPDLRSLVPDVPLGLAAAVALCLKRDPSERFSSVSELAAAIAPFGTPSATASAERIAGALGSAGAPQRDVASLDALPNAVESSANAWGSPSIASGRARGSPLFRVSATAIIVALVGGFGAFGLKRFRAQQPAFTGPAGVSSEPVATPPTAAGETAAPVPSDTIGSPIPATSASASASRPTSMAPARSGPSTAPHANRARPPAPAAASVTSATPPAKVSDGFTNSRHE